MAIKSHFGESGFDIWDSWSQGDDRYKPREAKTRWKSFKGGSARGKVSIGTILHWAFERGFKIDRPNMSVEEREKFRIEQEARRAQLAEQWAKEEKEMLRWYDVVADAANRLIPQFKRVGNSPYLGKKKIPSCGCYFAPHPFLLDFKADFTIDIITGHEEISRVWDRLKKNKADGRADDDVIMYFKRGSIIIPMADATGRIQNLQIIYSDGKTKRFMTNGRKSGLWFVIPAAPEIENSPWVFCEGFATGGSIHLATGWNVVVGFDAYNLTAVAAAWKDHPGEKIWAGDNDWKVALDPKKKNTGVVKAEQAMQIAGGTWGVPQFTKATKELPEFADNPKAPSDFNDLHLAEGLDVVRSQLQVILALPPATYSVDPPPCDIPNEGSPAPSRTVEQLTLVDLLQRYALIDPDSRVWDSLQKKILKASAFKNIVKPKMFKEWLDHDDRRTVLLDDVQWQAAEQQKRGRGGLAEALRRYVYLNPSDTVWDRQERELVAVSHLKIAIADCFSAWVVHPEREEIPHRYFVFDPTQKVDTKTHINQYRGLAITPINDVNRCHRIIQMLMALCNNNQKVFRWLRRWLAYPLQHPGAKMETAVLCHSDVHGSGKSFFFDVVMREIYGEYSRTVGQAQLEGQYNDWMSKVLYCVYEEVLSRSQRYSHTGTIKQTITGKTVRIEKKFMSGWEEANHMNAVFLSNEVLPLPVEPSDRRFLVIWPETKLYEHLQRGVDEELKNGGAAAFYQYLLDTPMQYEGEDFPFDPHTKPPMTEAKERLIEHGRPIWEVFYNAWASGTLLHNNNIVPYCCMRTDQLFKIFEAWCSQYREHCMGAHKFSSFISSKIKKRPDMHYVWSGTHGKGTVYLVGKCPEGKTQQEWIGAGVAEVDRIMALFNVPESATE